MAYLVGNCCIGGDLQVAPGWWWRGASHATTGEVDGGVGGDTPAQQGEGLVQARCGMVCDRVWPRWALWSGASRRHGGCRGRGGRHGEVARGGRKAQWRRPRLRPRLGEWGENAGWLPRPPVGMSKDTSGRVAWNRRPGRSTIIEY